VMEGDSRV